MYQCFWIQFAFFPSNAQGLNHEVFIWGLDFTDAVTGQKTWDIHNFLFIFFYLFPSFSPRLLDSKYMLPFCRETEAEKAMIISEAKSSVLFQIVSFANPPNIPETCGRPRAKALRVSSTVSRWYVFWDVLYVTCGWVGAGCFQVPGSYARIKLRYTQTATQQGSFAQSKTVAQMRKEYTVKMDSRSQESPQGPRLLYRPSFLWGFKGRSVSD